MSDEAAFVRLTYDEMARLGQSVLCCAPGALYSDAELATLPADVLRLSSGCGHPVDGADIGPGETVVDIGAGAGADCFLAAARTGPTGRVVGVDPSPAMRAQAGRYRDEAGLTWVSFVEGDASALPLPDGCADLVISNCVLSLVADAAVAWREIARVLKPTGRFVVSDIIGGARDAGPEAKARCETGLSWHEYRAILLGCGFHAVRILRAGAATFRDGFRAQSVTFAGERSASTVEAAVLHDPDHAAAASALLAEADAACRRLGLKAAGRTQPFDSPWGRQLLEVFGGRPEAELLLVLDGGPVLTACEADLPALGPTIEARLRKESR